MDALTIYFSYTGKTKIVAERKAAEENADILPLVLKKRRGNLYTYSLGSLAARRCKKAELNAPPEDFSKYKRFILAVPIWAGYPAPAANNVLPLIPEGSEVELIFTSGSGNSKKSSERIAKELAKRNVTVTKVTDIKASTI
jgi:hypothetical protein